MSPPSSSRPIRTEPLPTEPVPAEPVPAEPVPTEPLPTEPTVRWHRIERDGVGIAVADSGPEAGTPVLLVHGWPDTGAVWRHQIAALNEAGYRTLSVDTRGSGRSDRPGDVEAYVLAHLVGDLVAVLDDLGVDRAHVVGHDWGGAIVSVLAALVPDRVVTLTVMSVGHPRAFADAGWAQREKSWYMLLFQFEGVAERWLSDGGFANLRDWTGHPDIDEVVARLADPSALTAGLQLYRANTAPASLLEPPLELPPIPVPTMAINGDLDRFVTEEALVGTAAHVTGPWHHERITGAGHWMQLDRPDEVQRLLLAMFAEHAVTPAP